MNRKIVRLTKGFNAQDGNGVKLVRVLGHNTTEDFDPILMLDSFDSSNPSDYIGGFPMHPHRGIETITYLYKGKITHRDSLGNEDTISDGEVQWMTAGSGILHEEMIPPSPRMLGVQVWLNLMSKDKMTSPAYHNIKKDEIKEIKDGDSTIRLLCGRYKEHVGHLSKHQPLDFYDIHIKSNSSITIDTEYDNSVMLFTLLGSVYVGDELISEKVAVKLGKGDNITIKASGDAQVLFLSSKEIKEPIAWGGPIVMNTREELQKAFDDLKNGVFIADKINY